jgi:dihydrofolate reductase
MRKLVVLSFISLDGVMQAPGGSDEDRAEGFKYGGWSFPYFDKASHAEMDKQIAGSPDLLLGRKTYDIFAPYWPKQSGNIATLFDKATKYVVSHNKDLELTWDKSILITGDVAEQLEELKKTEGPMLQVHGSGNLVQTLLKNDLVDELWLKIFPITLGKGKRLFTDGAIPGTWEIFHTVTTPSGVIFANYKRAGEVKTGSFV